MRQALIVDDDSEMGGAIRLLLRLIDYEAVIALNARDCMSHMIKSGLPDVMILDMNMPGIGGMDLLSYLRKEAPYQKLPIVVLSSETEPPLVHKALDAGADAYLFKPVTLDELETAVKQALIKRA